MDCETGYNHNSPCKQIMKLKSKATSSQKQPESSNIFYSLNNGSYSLVDVQHCKLLYESTQVHLNRIGSMRYKDNLLITGGHDNTVKLFDCRTFALVHTFQRIPSKFNSIDKSEHILAGAYGTNIVFWDLRKMKQRSEFKESFNGEVTHIRFEDEVSTNLMGCSIDGMINMFDLTQPNEEEAFDWCYKLISSPSSFSVARQGRALVHTFDHNLYKIQDGDLFGKVSINCPEAPKHILFSQFKPSSNYQQYQYYAWQPQDKIVESWSGNFFDKDNQQDCKGYLYNIDDVQIFDVIAKHDNRIAIYVDEQGNLYAERFTSQVKYNKADKEQQLMEENTKITTNLNSEKSKKNGGSHSVQHKNNNHNAFHNRNGYMLQKPASSFSNHKKYKPY